MSQKKPRTGRFNSFFFNPRTSSSYYSRHLALIRPKGNHVHEFLITGHDETGTLAEIGGIFARHDVTVNALQAYADKEEASFVITSFCDFGRADCTAEQVSREISALTFVREVKSVSAKDALYDRYYF